MKLQDDHPALAIYNGFCGQTTEGNSAIHAENIITVQIPADCTDRLQPLDVAINKPMKDWLISNSLDWYSKEVSKQLKISSVKEVKVDVNMSVVKIPVLNGFQMLGRILKRNLKWQ